jgi:predicted DNA-binding protein
MAKSKTEKAPTQQIAVRLEGDLIERLDAVAKKLSRPGLDLTRTDAVRVCLLTGLQQIEKER